METQVERKVPELEDIKEMIHRYNAVHNDGCFVFSFLGFKKDPNHKCIDCGDDCDEFDETKSHLGVYGDIFTLRDMLNELRDIAEDCTDEEEFVNV